MPVFDPLPEPPDESALPLDGWGAHPWEVLDWPREGEDIGYNSRTWKITDGDATLVLKAVPGEHAGKFEVGLRAAARVGAAGIRSGAPRPGVDGALVRESGGWAWGLLEFVDGGRVDESDPAELERMGALLARIHDVLAPLPVPEHVLVWGQMDWLLAEGEFLEPYPWIRAAVREALDAVPDDLAVGVIHGDARPSEFRVADGAVGLIDWGEVMYAPRLFDVATALDYLEDEEADTDALVRGYLRHGTVDPAEMRHLPAIQKFRTAAEAWIYARRAWFSIGLGQNGEDTNDSILAMKHDDIVAIDSGTRRFPVPAG